MDIAVLLVSLATLIVTVAGIGIAWTAYRHQITMIEPWSMTKVGENMWLLQRNRPELATIHGIVPDYLGSTYRFIVHEGDNTFPAGYFRKGTSVLIEIESPTVGTNFTLCYMDHKKEKYKIDFPYYNSNVNNFQILSPEFLRVSSPIFKIWKTSIY